MTNEHDVKPYDAGLLSDVISDHNLTVKAIASRSGLDETSIYRYLSGERTIPSIIFRATFELTRDARILSLIVGCAPVELTVHQSIDRIPPLPQLLDQTCSAAEAAAKSLTYIAKILADGRIDDSDRNAISGFLRHAADCQRLLAHTSAAVSSNFQKGTR